MTFFREKACLESTVEWSYQWSSAEAAVMHLSGVRGVNNRMGVKPRVSASGIKDEVAAAFGRHALLDAADVEVDVDGGSAVLRGKVRNHAERDEA